MPIIIRLPKQEEKRITKMAEKTGKTKTAIILEAVSEKLGTCKNKKQLIRELSGWMSHDEAEKPRTHTQNFDQINVGDWV